MSTNIALSRAAVIDIIENDDAETMKKIIEDGLDIHSSNIFLYTVQTIKMKIAKLFINLKIDINKSNTYGVTPLMEIKLI